MAFAIREVRTGADLRRFIVKTNPFYQHADRALFLAEHDGVPVGRIAAIENRAHDVRHGDLGL
jgi:hypothetical protein